MNYTFQEPTIYQKNNGWYVINMGRQVGYFFRTDSLTLNYIGDIDSVKRFNKQFFNPCREIGLIYITFKVKSVR